MRVKGEEYSQRLETFSDDTLRLIISFMNHSTYKKAIQIAAETDYSEEEVVRRLKELDTSTYKEN